MQVSRSLFLPGLMLFTLIRTGEAAVEEQAVSVGAKPEPDFRQTLQFARASAFVSPAAPAVAPAAALTVAPASVDVLAAPTVPLSREFSTTDFRPRKHTLFDRDPEVELFGDAPMLRGTTVWQRMGDYRSRDRVRLLTLWDSGGSTVSLQAGKRGDPSLQWTSTAMNRGGSTRGLLDRLFSVSIAGAGASLRHAAHVSTPAASQQTSGAVVAGNKQ